MRRGLRVDQNANFAEHPRSTKAEHRQDENGKRRALLSPNWMITTIGA